MLPIPNSELYEGMTIEEVLEERRNTLETIRRFHADRPTKSKADRIQEIDEEIRALELLVKGE